MFEIRAAMPTKSGFMHFTLTSTWWVWLLQLDLASSLLFAIKIGHNFPVDGGKEKFWLF